MKSIIISRTTDKSLKFIQEIINKDPRDINFLLKSDSRKKIKNQVFLKVIKNRL